MQTGSACKDELATHRGVSIKLAGHSMKPPYPMRPDMRAAAAWRPR